MDESQCTEQGASHDKMRTSCAGCTGCLVSLLGDCEALSNLLGEIRPTPISLLSESAPRHVRTRVRYVPARLLGSRV
jgi:hypothetical protein